MFTNNLLKKLSPVDTYVHLGRSRHSQHFFQRLCMILLLSLVGIGAAWAEDVVHEWTMGTSTETSVSSFFTTTGSSKSLSSDGYHNDSYTPQGGSVITSGLKMDSSGKLTFTTDGLTSITIAAEVKSGDEKSYIYVVEGTNKTQKKVSGSVTEVTYSGNAGSYSIEKGSTEAILLYVKVVVTPCYTISYELNGFGGLIPDAPNSVALPNPLPNPSFGGTVVETGNGFAWNGATPMEFIGWFTDNALTQPAVAGNTLSGNTTLYAKWSNDNVYRLSYNANGGTGTPPATTVHTRDVQVTVQGKGDLSKAGYTFEGWQIDRDGTIYTEGSNLTLNANRTLYAKWNEDSSGKTIGNTDYTTGFGGAQSDHVSLLDGETVTFSFVNNNKVDGDVWKNWLVMTGALATLRADAWYWNYEQPGFHVDQQGTWNDGFQSLMNGANVVIKVSRVGNCLYYYADMTMNDGITKANLNHCEDYTDKSDFNIVWVSVENAYLTNFTYSVSANVTKSVTLATNGNGTISGTVKGGPALAVGNNNVIDHANIILTATPNSGYKFDAAGDHPWGTATGATDNPLDYNIIDNKAFTAHFVELSAPTISVQPVGASYTLNQTATALTVTADGAEGGEITYKWYKTTENNNSGGTEVASTQTYVPLTTVAGTAYYYCVATETVNTQNAKGSKTVVSDAVAIVVTSGVTKTDKFSMAVAATTEKQTAASSQTVLTAPDATITGGTVTHINGKDAVQNYISSVGGKYDFALTQTATSFKLELDQPIAVGDIISADVYNNKAARGLWFTTSTTRPNSCSQALTTNGANANELQNIEYEVQAGDPIVGQTVIYVFRETGNNTYFNNLKITSVSGGDTTPLSIAGIAPANQSVAKGVDAQNITVTVSGGARPYLYKWYVKEGSGEYALIGGANAATYLPSTETAGNYTYKCVVNDANEDEVTSSEVTVEVYNTYVVNASAATENTGTVTITSGGKTLASGDAVKAGTTVTLTATPATDYTFTQWSDGNTNAARNITVNSDVNLTATFTSNDAGLLPSDLAVLKSVFLNLKGTTAYNLVKGTDFSTSSNGAIGYRTSNAAVATVDASGTITAKAVGSTTIVVTVGKDATYQTGSIEIPVTVVDGIVYYDATSGAQVYLTKANEAANQYFIVTNPSRFVVKNGVNAYELKSNTGSLTFNAKNAKAFAIGMYNSSNADRSYQVSVDDGAKTTVTAPKGSSLSQPFAMNEAGSVITLTNSSSSSVYPEYIIFYNKMPAFITVKDDGQDVTSMDLFVDDANKNLTVSSTSTGAISIVTAGDDAFDNSILDATLSGSTLTIDPKLPGTTTVVLSQVAYGDFAAATKAITVTVSKHKYVMTFSPKEIVLDKSNLTSDANIDLGVTERQQTIGGQTITVPSFPTLSYSLDGGDPVVTHLNSGGDTFLELLNYSSDDVSLATATKNPKAVTVISGSRGRVKITATLPATPTYDEATASYTIIVKNGYDYALPSTKTPKVEEKFYLKGAGDETLVTMTYGGWNHGEGGSQSWEFTDMSGNKKTVTDAWKTPVVYTVGTTVNYVDGYDFSSQANTDSRSETRGQIVWETTDTKIHPFSLPCRGAYLTMTPEKNGTLTLYVLQNGCINWKNGENGVFDETNPISASPRVYYWFDQDGNVIRPDNVTVKQPFTVGRDDSHIQATIDGWPADAKALIGTGSGAWKNKSSLDNVTPEPAYPYHNGHFIIEKAYVKYVVTVEAGKTYYFFSNNSKLGFAGINFKATSDNTGNLPLQQAVTYAPPSVKTTYATVTLDRPFKAGTWNTICLPFAVSEDQVKEVFGDGTQLIIFNGFENKTAKFIYHVYQNILPGQAYLIKPAWTINKGDLEFKNITVDPGTVVKNNGLTGDSSFDFVGSFNTITLNAYDHYIDSEGKITYFATGTTNMPGYRAYLRNLTRPDSSGAKAVISSVSVGGFGDIDDDPTGIMEVLLNDMNVNYSPVRGVFNMNGQKVANSTAGLPAGLYIVDGRKVFIK